MVKDGVREFVYDVDGLAFLVLCGYTGVPGMIWNDKH